ncbi:MAG: hypothetical protein J1G01_04740 [Clostridiales bacterium]|nr:hypothetical protein [Clostridiales bacterium]
MINISKKKLPSAAIAVIVYVSYCAMSWFSARGTIAYFGEQYDLPNWFVNDVWAFFIGGLVPFLLFEVLCSFIFRTMIAKTNGGDVQSLRYGLNYAVIAANVLLFLLKFIYIAVPLYSVVIDIIIDPVVTIAFVALYMWYAFYQDYVERSQYRLVLTQVLGAFLSVYGLLALINMVISVA